MKNLAWAALCVAFPFLSFSQVSSLPAARYQITSVTGTSPNFSVEGQVFDEIGVWDAASFAVNDKVYVLDGGGVWELNITAISTGAGTTLNCILNDPLGTLGMCPTGQAALLRRTTSNGYQYGISGLREDLKWEIERHFRVKVDAASGVVNTDATLAGNGTIGTPLKVAQQGATNGQVLKWNGSTWFPASDIGGGTGDDLGNHTATQNLNINGFQIVGAVGITSAGSASVPAVYQNGVLRVATAIVATNTTLNGTHAKIAVNCTSGNVTITLPAIAADKYGWTYTIYRIDRSANVLSVSGDFPDGLTAFTITGNQAIEVTCFSDNWRTNF